MRPAPGRNEWSLTIFTVLAQAAAGIAVARAAAWALGGPAGEALLPVALALLVAAVALAVLHLGRPGAARFALRNLRSSWLSREILLAAIFGAVLVAEFATGHRALAIGSATAGLALVFAIAKVYRIRTVPAWDTPTTPAAFFLTALLLGFAAYTLAQADPASAILTAAFAGLQLFVNRLHLATLAGGERAARESTALLLGRLRLLLVVRIGFTASGATILLVAAAPILVLGPGARGAIGVATALLLAGELLGRHLFYASHRRVGL